MGLLDRFRGVRQETSERVWNTAATKNSPPTYVSDFIVEGSWDKYNPDHLSKMARENASAYNLTYGIAANIFDDGFKFIDPNDPEKEIMEDVQKELERIEAKKWLSLALAYERIHGHAWLFVSPEDVTLRTDSYTGPPRVVGLDVFTKDYCEPSKWDDTGFPELLKVKVLTNAGASAAQYWEKDVYASECILFRTRIYDRSHEGLSVLWPIWDPLCGMNFVFHSIISYDMKIGMGALVMKTKAMVSEADQAAAETTMEDLSVTRVAIIPGNKVESLDFVGATNSGASSFPAHIDVFRDEISTGSKIPKDVMVGTSAGAITGSEVNSKALYAVIQGIQTSMEPYIRELVRRMGFAEEDYDIEWNVRYATDEMQQAQIRELNIRADEAEMRIQGMKKMLESGKDPNEIRITDQTGKPKDEKENKNPSGRQ